MGEEEGGRGKVVGVGWEGTNYLMAKATRKTIYPTMESLLRTPEYRAPA